MTTSIERLSCEAILRFVARANVASCLETVANASGYRLMSVATARAAETLSEICDVLAVRDEEDLLHELISFALVGSRFMAEVRRSTGLLGGSAPHLLTILVLGRGADRIQALGRTELFNKAGGGLDVAIPRAIEAISHPA